MLKREVDLIGGSAPVLYTIRDLAKILQLSEQRIRELIHTEKLKAVRIGVELRVRHEQLEQLLQENPVGGRTEARDGRRRGKKPGARPTRATEETPV